MTALELLDRLLDLDVHLWLEHGTLKFSAPDGVMTPELRALIVEHKPQILDVLRAADGSTGAGTVNIQPVPRDGELELSYQQLGLWIQDQLAPGTPAFNIPGVLRLVGRLDPEQLEASLNQVIARHEPLRTRFPSLGGRPHQVIEPELWLPLEVVDLSCLECGHLERGHLEREVARIAAAETAASFDLAAGPLLHFILLRLGEAEHVLVLRMHHIIADGWSIGVFFQEMAALAEARHHGHEPRLPPLPIQYADFAAWQRRWLEGDEAGRQLEHWVAQLGQAPRALDLPADLPRPPVRTMAGAVHFFTYPRSLLDGARALSRRLGVTLYTVLLAAFKAVLLRYTGEHDLVVGSLIAQRDREQLENLIGFFVNAVALRTDIGSDPTFREVVTRVGQTVLGAQANQSIPFEMVMDRLRVARDPSRSPLFQIMFILQNAPVELPQMPGVRLEQIDPERSTSIYDLFFSMIQTADGFSCEVEYSTELLEAATIVRLTEHLRLMLEAVIEDPDHLVRRVPLLTSAEQELLPRWESGPPAARPEAPGEVGDTCLHHLISKQARRHPHRTAVVSDGAALTYGELERRSNRLAHHLIRHGAGPEQVVGILLDRSPLLIVAVLGVLKAGAAFLALDPAAPERRLRSLIDQARAALVITSEDLVAVIPGPGPVPVVLDPGPEMLSGEPDQKPSTMVLPDNLASLVFTSGSTGAPKGVMVRHRSLVNAAQAWNDAYRLDGEVRCHLQAAAFTFDVFTGDLVRALTTGGRLVLCPRESLLSPAELLALVDEQEVDCVELVPAVLRILLEHLEATGRRLDRMRLLICGSDTWYGAEHRRVRGVLGETTRLVSSFGLTEGTIDTTWFEGGLPPARDTLPVPIGRPFPGMRVAVLDGEGGRCPIGVPGELHVGGDALARGYAGRPGLTAERFVPDPDAREPGARLYRTGDLARWRADGNLELLGRIDGQLKISGVRIEPGEIETVLGRHRAVRRSVVLAREAGSGAAGARLVAFVVPSADPPSVAELREHLGQELPPAMVPSAFVMLERLPLTPSGKVDRRALGELEVSRIDLPEAVAPRTPVEQRLAGLWAEVLGLESVGVTTSFFELGGSSLLATQIIARVRAVFGLELDLRRFFAAPTLAEVARMIELGGEAPSHLPSPLEVLDDFEEGAL